MTKKVFFAQKSVFLKYVSSDKRVCIVHVFAFFER